MERRGGWQADPAPEGWLSITPPGEDPRPQWAWYEPDRAAMRVGFDWSARRMGYQQFDTWRVTGEPCAEPIP